MNNKRMDEIYKQIVAKLPEYDINHNNYLKDFKKLLNDDDIKKIYNIFKSKKMRVLGGEIPKTLEPVEGVLKLIVDIHNSKKLLAKLLAMEAIVFERDKYYAKSSMCKACKEIRLNAFAKYERIKSTYDK